MPFLAKCIWLTLSIPRRLLTQSVRMGNACKTGAPWSQDRIRRNAALRVGSSACACALSRVPPCSSASSWRAPPHHRERRARRQRARERALASGQRRQRRRRSRDARAGSCRDGSCIRQAGRTGAPRRAPFPLHSLSAGHVALVGLAESGRLMRTLYGGASWDEVKLAGKPAAMAEVALDRSGEGLALVGPSELLTSNDDGATWKPIASRSALSVFVATDGALYAEY